MGCLKNEKATQSGRFCLVRNPTDTQNEPQNGLFWLKIDGFVQFLEYISFPQQVALKYLLMNRKSDLCLTVDKERWFTPPTT